MGKKALGKGLSSIFEDLGTPVLNSENGEMIHEIEVGKIDPNPYQPRKEFRKEELSELSKSIKRSGLLSPILLRRHGDRFQIIAGERRYRSVCLLGYDKVKSYVRDKVTDRDMTELSLIENIQRVQLSPIEEAKAYIQLINQCGYTHENLSEKLSKSRSTVTNTLRLLKLNHKVQALVSEGKLSSGHARALLQLPEDQQLAFAQKIIEENINVRNSETIASSKKPKEKKPTKKLDPNLNAFIQDLQYASGFRLTLTGTDKKGKLVIHYNSQSELQTLSDVIKNGFK